MTYEEQKAEWEERAQEITSLAYSGKPNEFGPGIMKQKLIEAQRDAAWEMRSHCINVLVAVTEKLA